MHTGAVLVIEAPLDGEPLSVSLAAAGTRVRSAGSIESGLSANAAESFGAVLIDTRCLDGAELADVIERFEQVPVVVAGPAGARAAVAAMRAGAADYVELPCDGAGLAYAVGGVLAARAADALEPPKPTVRGSKLLGESRSMQRVHDVMRRVAPGNATVLVRGESGTGKELVARAIHAQSPRAAGPFVKVHCAGLPETLLESELFGYERGAFTGASARKAGRVELAEGGTLFFDEIGDITPAMQVKLLRLLQDREYERLGGSVTLRVDARFVAATHKDLEHLIKKGEYREDLFYRLNVVPIWLPPLRARRGDVAELARHFCEAFAELHGKPGVTFTEAAIGALAAERWPGNVRQLQNFVERLVVLTEANAIGAEDVHRELSPEGTFATQGSTGTTATARTGAGGSPVVPLDSALREAERRAIERALRHANGNRSLAARMLGVSRASLYNKLGEYGLR